MWNVDMEDPLNAERRNPTAIKAIIERYGVDEATATDMWNRFIDTTAKLRERAEAQGKT